MSEPKKLKRVVIKEELFALTGDFKEAIILNQFNYWSERRSDFDKFVEEENKHITHNDFINKVNQDEEHILSLKEEIIYLRKMLE